MSISSPRPTSFESVSTVYQRPLEKDGRRCPGMGLRRVGPRRRRKPIWQPLSLDEGKCAALLRAPGRLLVAPCLLKERLPRNLYLPRRLGPFEIHYLSGLSSTVL